MTSKDRPGGLQIPVTDGGARTCLTTACEDKSTPPGPLVGGRHLGCILEGSPRLGGTPTEICTKAAGRRRWVLVGRHFWYLASDQVSVARVTPQTRGCCPLRAPWVAQGEAGWSRLAGARRCPLVSGQEPSQRQRTRAPALPPTGESLHSLTMGTGSPHPATRQNKDTTTLVPADTNQSGMCRS